MRRPAETSSRSPQAAQRARAALSALAATVLGWSVALAQSSYNKLEQNAADGNLTVWIVSPELDPHPLTPQQLAARLAILPGYKEQTAGTFGQPASSIGQSAGNTGQTAGTLGQPASSVGQTAGTVGQTAGTLEPSVSDGSRNAGDIGQSAGTFGSSIGNIAQVAAANNRLIPPSHQPRRDGEWQALTSLERSPLRSGTVTFVDIYANNLKTLLGAVTGTPEAPDVIVAAPLPPIWWAELARRYGVAQLWQPWLFAQTAEESSTRTGFVPEAAVLAAARNPEAARAFALWVEDWGAAGQLLLSDRTHDPIVQVADRAVIDLLGGGTVGSDADPDMAPINRDLTASMLVGMQLNSPRPDPPDRLEVHADATALKVFGNLAFVAVRAVALGPHTFGVAHALLVLRRQAQGGWKILQVSPDLPGSEQGYAWNALVDYSNGPLKPGVEGSAVLRDEGTKVLGVSLAAPADGARSSQPPELWWDNLGGATLQVVEWQRGTPNRWSTSNLYFVPDNGDRLKTRVVARFAAAGQYRWRVWSIGPGGALVLSPWRTMIVG